MFGDMDKERQKNDEETIYRLDTYCFAKGWTAIMISDSPLACCQNGFIPLFDMKDDQGTDKSLLLVFGGC
jgi:hypothetical protein